MEGWQKEMVAKDELLKEKDVRIEELQKLLNQKDGLLKEQRDELQQNGETFGNKNKELEGEIERLRSEKELLSSTVDQENEKLKQQSETDLRIFREKISSQEAEIGELKSEIERLEVMKGVLNALESK
jgi:chromosome segregation ATPase